MNSPYTSVHNRGILGLVEDVSLSRAHCSIASETSPLLGGLRARFSSVESIRSNESGKSTHLDDDISPLKHLEESEAIIKSSWSAYWWHALVFGMIVIGSCKRLAAKAIFNLGLKDPDFMTCSAFLSMSLVLSLHICRPSHEFLPNPSSGVKRINTLSVFFLALIPSLLNFIGVAINFYALMVLPASIVSIIHSGAEILSVALLRRFFLKFELHFGQWIASFLVTAGLFTVGSSHLYYSPVSLEASAAFGMALMILRTIVGAGKTTIEEILFQRYNTPVHLVVGFEGISSFTIAFAFWILKNPEGPWKVLSGFQSFPILFAWLAFMAVVGTTETLSGCVTAYSSALTFCVYKSLRPFVLWALSLLEYYIISNALGEQWSGESWFQLVGLVLVSAGIWIYRISVEINVEKDDYSLSSPAPRMSAMTSLPFALMSDIPSVPLPLSHVSLHASTSTGESP